MFGIQHREPVVSSGNIKVYQSFISEFCPSIKRIDTETGKPKRICIFNGTIRYCIEIRNGKIACTFAYGTILISSCITTKGCVDGKFSKLVVATNKKVSIYFRCPVMANIIAAFVCVVGSIYWIGGPDRTRDMVLCKAIVFVIVEP